MVNTAMRADKGVHVRYLTSNSHTVCPIHSLDNAPNMLHGSHKGRELVLLEVCEAGDDACGDDKDIYRSLRETPVRRRTLDGEQEHRRPGTIGFRLTMAAARPER